MFEPKIQNGDLVYAAENLLSDGHVPGTDEGQVLVPQGTRGMVVQVGHVEATPEITVFLVQFEDAEGNLGDALGCLEHEVSHERPEAAPETASEAASAAP